MRPAFPIISLRIYDSKTILIRQGLEADFSYQNEDYGWKFAMTLVDVDLSRDDNPAVMPLVPNLQVSASLWYKPLDSLTLQLHGRYLDDQVQGNDYQRDLRAIPSYYLVHVSTNWEVTDDLVFVAGVNNVLDKVHAVSAYSGGFYAGVGRQAFLSMRYQY